MMAGHGEGIAVGGPARHIPVMLDEVLSALSPRAGETVIDGTFGAGGYTRAILTSGAHVVAVDRDPDAIAAGRALEAEAGGRLRLVHGRFSALDEAAGAPADCVVLDIGVSSMQLDEAERGFSYMQDAPLDMRMNRTEGETAADLVASLSEHELRDLFFRYGDEKLAPRYARAIVRAREEAPVSTTGALVDILQAATPAAKKNAGHPAKRVFQALRIKVNGELDALESAIPQALDRVRVGGRVVVESYQSLEDRFVKRTFAQVTESQAPRDLPFVPPELEPKFSLLTRGAEQASAAEADLNPRAKPVRLRAVTRIRK